MNKTKEILTEDTNFSEIYNDVNEAIMNFFNKENIQEQKQEENIGGGEELRSFRWLS